MLFRVYAFMYVGLVLSFFIGVYVYVSGINLYWFPPLYSVHACCEFVLCACVLRIYIWDFHVYV